MCLFLKDIKLIIYVYIRVLVFVSGFHVVVGVIQLGRTVNIYRA